MEGRTLLGVENAASIHMVGLRGVPREKKIVRLWGPAREQRVKIRSTKNALISRTSPYLRESSESSQKREPKPKKMCRKPKIPKKRLCRFFCHSTQRPTMMCLITWRRYSRFHNRDLKIFVHLWFNTIFHTRFCVRDGRRKDWISNEPLMYSAYAIFRRRRPSTTTGTFTPPTASGGGPFV
jgi:hypothetical protein